MKLSTKRKTIFLQEQKIEVNDPTISPEDKFDGNILSSQHIGADSKRESSFTGGSSSNRTLRSITKSLKLKQQISQLKEKLEESESNSILLKNEIQNLRNELLNWVARWQTLKTKKAKIKADNRYLVSENEKMLKHEEQYKIEIIKLKAKLSKARRATKLQISS